MRRLSERTGQRLSGGLWAGVWLWPLLSPAGRVLSGRVHPAGVAGAGLLAFVALYLVVVVTSFDAEATMSMRWRFRLLVALAVIGVTLEIAYGRESAGWLAMLLYVGAAGAATLTTRDWQVYAWTLASVGTLVMLGLAQHTPAADLGGDAFSALMACALVFTMKKMTLYIHLLRSTQAELARSAVVQERLRFSRDLHDLLGHTLSVIVVKAEVVRRLADQPELVAREAGEVEAIGRQALMEVREAVTGYRERAFAAELDGARAALSDAGIAVTVLEVGTPLPPEADALFGWAVREGVTNVIRHSRAAACHILVRQDGTHATLEIRDDGNGGAVTGSGNGLRGLAERLSAAGGTLLAEPAAEGGFRLVARL